jgi:CheY-like chemotaxis protein
VVSHSADNAGTVLFLIATHDLQTAVQLSKDSRLNTAETAYQLHRLTEFGFIVAVSSATTGLAAYRLNAKELRTEARDRHERILVVEDTDAVRGLVSGILEDDGYAVIATRWPANAATLLEEVAFDLVITDSYSYIPSGTFASTAEVLHAAGATPVALFTAHRVDLSAAQTTGFRDVISKPFDLDTLLQQVRRILGN